MAPPRKNKIARERSREIRISAIPENTRNQLSNLAANLGVTVSSLMKPEVTKVLERYPENMKQPPLKD